MDIRFSTREAGSLGRALLVSLTLAGGLSGAAHADLVLSDPSSEVYYSLALAAGGTVHVDKAASVVGDVHSNTRVTNDKESRVQGDVTSVGDVSEKGAIDGAVVEGAASRALPRLATESDLRGLADRVIEGDHTFGDEAIGEVVFVTGKARLTGRLAGRGTVIAARGIVVEAVAAGAGAGLLDPESRISLISPAPIHIGSYRSFRGAAYSGADLVVEKGAAIEGVLLAAKNLHLHKESSVVFLELDETSPVITGPTPAPDAWVGTRTPVIGADFSDDLSLVDPATVEVAIDGEPVVPTEVTAGGFRFEPVEPLGPGEHSVTLALVDHAGHAAGVDWSFRIDTTTPVVRFASPGPDLVSGEATIPLVLDLYDSGSGIDPASFAVDVSGQAVGCDGAGGRKTCLSPPLATGDHRATATVADRAGNSATAVLDFTFALDLEPPVVTVESPGDGVHLASTPVSLVFTAADDVGLESLAVNGAPLDPAPGRRTVSLDLLEGSNPVTVAARDRLGREAFARLDLVLDTRPPQVTVLSPVPGSRVNQAEVELQVRVDDAGEVASVSVAGEPASPDALDFRAVASLAPGPNQVLVRAVDRAGNAGEAVVDLELFTLPEVAIDTPEDLEYLAATTVDVSGTVGSTTASVAVNGVPATISGGRFVAAGVPLVEGGNVLTATATDGAGRVGTDSINVVRDLTPPRLEIHAPRPGAVLVEPTVVVSGMVNDIVAGTVNAAQASVTVGGVAARVANRSFVADGVVLEPGLNVLEVEALDASGNRSRAQVRVFLDPARPSLRKTSGDRQVAPIGTPLPAPLEVELRDAAGLPLSDRTVLFKVAEGDGRFPGGGRRVAVVTDAAGRARTDFILGSRSGVAAQSVEALVAGFAGDGVFTFDVLPGEPATVVVDAGDQQVGIAGRPLPRPLVAAVIDAGANRLADVPVLFQVVDGSGRFENGERQIEVVTDGDGRVVVPFVLGGTEGVASNVVLSVVRGAPEAGRATFTATGWVAGEPSETAIRGVVLDNTNRPIPGATVRIRDGHHTAVTDARGRFRIAPAPVGTVKLIVDGSTTDRPGAWPDLEFVLTTVAGRENDVGMPIFLLPLDLENGLYVDETRGGMLTLPEIPGFTLEIEPGSVTFPNGSKSGLLSVTAVHSDKVPMVPNFGQQPQLIVTIQPAGARFDPPARLTLPNVESLAPGQVSEMYSFDHDLGHFVSIGPAAVSEDGLVMRSAPGVGVLKAGWHCGGNPSGSGTTHDCPDCQKCENDTCVPDDGASPGGACRSVSLMGELETATSLAESALQKVPFVDEVSVMASVSGEECPTCCNGSELDPGEVTGGGSVTAEAIVEKTLSPIDVPRTEVERTFLGVEVEFEVEIAVGPFIRGTPVASFDVELSRDLCSGEGCFTVRGCGGFTLTVGGQAKSILELEIEVGGTDLVDVDVEIVAEASASAPGVARVQYATGASCPEPGFVADGCLADVTGDIILIVDDLFEARYTWTFFEGTDGCGCA